MDFVTIKSSHIEADLLVTKSILESEGIECYMKNEYMNQIMSHMSTFVVELQVSSSDLERALEILNEIEEKS